MNIGITNDHRGVEVKNFLTNYLNELGYNVIDYGTNSNEPADFPDYAKKLGEGIINKEVELGIAICGTGIGMSIALNKMKGIYCAKVSMVSEASLAKAHNDANTIAISEEMDRELMKDVISTFINTPFTNIDRYKNRNNKIKDIENNV
ncbi:MAG: RpiB/LacA/LacB family sugar-phosphate isomerase [Bacilli bacterium]|nr:RpiB/LacA/LacB family sugar-phosphate isomerase [Bacilli bacterium]